MSGDDDDEDENDVKKSAAADARPEEPDETLAAEGVHAGDARPEEPKRKKWYLFSTTEISTRFCLAFEMTDRKDGFNATNLLKETLRRTGKVPAVFTTDALPSYSEAHQARLQPRIRWTNTACMSATLVSTAKRNTTTFRNGSTGRTASSSAPDRTFQVRARPLIAGFFVYYNFVRPHSSLNERTPAEAAGIIIHGVDKWRTIIGNASLAARATEAGP